MNLLCLCPTYGRPPTLLETTTELFMRQDYPTDQRLLCLLDDLGNVPTRNIADSVSIFSTGQRFESLPAKYDFATAPWDGWHRFAFQEFAWDAVVVWDDDDIYLPWHLRSHAAALADHGWSKPSMIRSTYGCRAGQTIVESATGRFHGSVAIRREMLPRMGGWLGVMPPGEATRADFDQRMIAALQAIEPPGDPLQFDPSPSYVYGWGRSQHCSGLMGHSDWYARHAETAYTAPIEQLTPQLDPHAAQIVAALV